MRVLLIALIFLSANLCQAKLKDYPLFDKSYKIIANYHPFLVLRAFGRSGLYKEKGKAHLFRRYYVKGLDGKLAEPYEVLELDITVKGDGWLGRKIFAVGHLNEFKLHYSCMIDGHINRTADLKGMADLDLNVFYDMDIVSSAGDLTNNVKGTFFDDKVEYVTKWRESKGMMAGEKFNLYIEGNDEDEPLQVKMTGQIGEYEISGSGGEVKQIGEAKPKKNQKFYEFEEQFGPIIVKDYLTVTLD